MSDLRVGLMQLAFAVGGAGVFLVAALVLRKGLHLALEPGLAWTRPTFERIDRFLALRAARWVGLDEVSRLRRWGRLIGVLLGAAVIGALTPPFVAAPVLVLGLVAIVAVFRRWAWDEEDRAAGLGPQHKRAPGVEDFTNELMLALAAVFMLGGLLIWRMTGLHLFVERPGAGLMDGVLYVASEALEALPIFGNVEVLGYDNPSRVQAVLPTGGWVAFALRMALDLMVIGGLLKMLEVARRIAHGQDLRRYDEAVAGDDDDKAQEAVASIAFYGLKGDRGAIDRLRAIARPSAFDAAEQPLRRRLQAIHMIESIVDDGAADAYELLYFAVDALREMEEDPGLEASGCYGMLHRQAAELWVKLSHRVTPTHAVECMDRAIFHFARALDHKGDVLAFTQVAWEGTREELLRETRAQTLIHYIDLLIARSREAEDAEAVRFARRAQHAARRLLAETSKEAAPATWAERKSRLGDALSCEGVATEGYAGGVLLTDALDAYDEALAAFSPESDVGAWRSIRTSIGVVRHFLSGRTDGEEAQQHLELAIAATREVVESLEETGDDERAEDRRWYFTALNNLGHQTLDLARLYAEDDPRRRERLEQAREHFAGTGLRPAAREEYEPLWLDAMIQLRLCHHSLWRLTEGEEKTYHLSQALAAAEQVFNINDSRRDLKGWADAAMEFSVFQAQSGLDQRSGDIVGQALSRAYQVRNAYEGVGDAPSLERVNGFIDELETMLGLKEGADGPTE